MSLWQFIILHVEVIFPASYSAVNEQPNYWITYLLLHTQLVPMLNVTVKHIGVISLQRWTCSLPEIRKSCLKHQWHLLLMLHSCHVVTTIYYDQPTVEKLLTSQLKLWLLQYLCPPFGTMHYWGVSIMHSSLHGQNDYHQQHSLTTKQLLCIS